MANVWRSLFGGGCLLCDKCDAHGIACCMFLYVVRCSLCVVDWCVLCVVCVLFVRCVWFVVCCLLFEAMRVVRCCLLSVVLWLLASSVRCSLFVVFCSLFVGRYVLSVVYRLLRGDCCALFGVRCSMCVVCGSMSVVVRGVLFLVVLL